MRLERAARHVTQNTVPQATPAIGPATKNEVFVPMGNPRRAFKRLFGALLGLPREGVTDEIRTAIEAAGHRLKESGENTTFVVADHECDSQDMEATVMANGYLHLLVTSDLGWISVAKIGTEIVDKAASWYEAANGARLLEMASAHLGEMYYPPDGKQGHFYILA